MSKIVAIENANELSLSHSPHWHRQWAIRCISPLVGTSCQRPQSGRDEIRRKNSMQKKIFVEENFSERCRRNVRCSKDFIGWPFCSRLHRTSERSERSILDVDDDVSFELFVGHHSFADSFSFPSSSPISESKQIRPWWFFLPMSRFEALVFLLIST